MDAADEENKGDCDDDFTKQVERRGLTFK